MGKGRVFSDIPLLIIIIDKTPRGSENRFERPAPEVEVVDESQECSVKRPNRLECMNKNIKE